MARQFTVVGLGEILWDLLPTGHQLGGAPTNFAYISTLLGDHGLVASRVGQDDLGNETTRRLDTLGLDRTYLQLDSTHPTGTVSVDLDKAGQPIFVIHENVAWDFLNWSTGWPDLAAAADAVCFGTLAQRSPSSRETIHNFLQHSRPDAIRVFDVNLRQAFYSEEILHESISIATIVKMNHDEFPIIRRLLGINGDDASTLLKFGLKLVCLTRGNQGSLLITENEREEHPGFLVKVVDTIGAGDAFTAALVHHYLRGASLGTMSDAANRVGSWVATQSGGTPVTSREQLRRSLASLTLNKA